MRKYLLRIYTKSKKEYHNLLKEDLKKERKRFIITVNPESLMHATSDAEMDKMLKDENVSLVPDGIAIVKACKILKYPIRERITGVDIAEYLLKECNKQKKSIYLFGAKPEVINTFVNKIQVEYPNIKILGYSDGYVKDRDKIFNEITKLKPDVCMVALGIPYQEKIIYKYINEFKKGIFVGVGGSFDVLSGTKKRAPKLFIKLNLEWFYRIMCEPKRIKRFWNNNVKFIFSIYKEKKTVIEDTKEKVLDINVSLTSYEKLLNDISENIEKNKKTFIVAINPEKILLANKDSKLKNIINSATYQIPDGVGVIMASKLKTGHIKKRITGIDLMEKICILSNEKKYKIFLYGSKEEVVNKLKNILEKKYPNLRVVGYENGYITNEEKLILKINKAKPDILFVALGSPKQEIFINNNLEKINCKIFQGVGGSFDVLCGKIKRAPKWMQKLGLEWLYRLIKEPKRIKRYLKLYKFLFLSKKKKQKN